MVFDQLSDFRYFSADTDPIFRYSLTLAHSIKYAIFAFLKRRLVQRCCNFCRSCCLLCLNFSFECCAYLSAWRSVATPVNSCFYCYLYSEISRAQYYDVIDRILITDTVEMSRYRLILIIPIQFSVQLYLQYRSTHSKYL